MRQLDDSVIDRIDKLLGIASDTFDRPKLKVIHDIAVRELEEVAKQIEEEAAEDARMAAEEKAERAKYAAEQKEVKNG